MRIMRREQVGEIILSMEQAYDYLKTVSDKLAAEELLVTCQETAEALANLVKNNEQPERISEFLDHVEQYYNLIYQLYVSNIEDWGVFLPQMEMELSLMKECFEKDIPIEKMKAVFLPYNASMWDSFHSVYEATKKDDRFDVRVIPIPYCSFAQNWKVDQIHYEGKQISKYAPITDYRQYDLKTEKPDVIFIHNPYDQYNRVTQIHKDFFSTELIKHTSHLVYIPYYVSKTVTDKEFTKVPGVVNAWKIFVESEVAKNTYVRYGVPESKVVALGSPKYDMVLKMENEGAEIPEEWSVLKGKQVFFYNTHLNGIMLNGEAFLKKIEHVFSVFEKHPEAALLWRPHPLAISMFKTDRPDLLPEYEKLIERIKNGTFGVYDETDMMERTIAISDAYIGEEQSSVSPLYAATGKPMYFVETDNSNYGLSKQYARALCGEVVGSKLYMYSWEYNMIFIQDLETGELEVERGNENYPVSEKFMYGSSVADGTVLYFLPCSTTMEVLRYDTVTKEKEAIKIGEEPNDYDPVLEGEQLYLLPVYASDFFWSINRKNGEVEKLPTNYRKNIPGIEKEDRKVLFTNGILANGRFWRGSCFGPYIQILSLEEKRFGYVQIADWSKPIRDLTFDGTYFWGISLYGTTVFQWDAEENKILQTIEIEDLESLDNTMAFYSIYFCNGCVWIVPLKGTKVVCIDIQTSVVEKLDVGVVTKFRCDNENKLPFAANALLYEDTLLLLPYHSNGIIKIDTKTKEISFQKTELTPEKKMEKVYGNSVNENVCSVEEFIDWCHSSTTEKQVQDRKYAGDKIWEYIVQNM